MQMQPQVDESSLRVASSLVVTLSDDAIRILATPQHPRQHSAVGLPELLLLKALATDTRARVGPVVDPVAGRTGT